MKRYHLIINSLITLLVFSCNSDEVVCDDLLDTPQAVCDNSLLIMRSEASTGAEQTFFLDSIQKPVNIPLVFNNIHNEEQASFFNTFTRPSNYDAYNSENNTYFIEFPFEQRLFKYDIDIQNRTEFIVSGYYSAPVFLNGVLYTIIIDNFGYATNPANFEISTIDQNSGGLNSILASDSFALLSRFDWESMSSTSNKIDEVYFISGTNLIAYNTVLQTVEHTELVPDFDLATNYQRYYGLEMRDNGNLLTIRERDNDEGQGLELIELNINNLGDTPLVIFDFPLNGIEINPEFYSSSYDACDDKYYITSRDINNANTTNFYELNLANSTYVFENFDYYLMGIHSKN